jgi:hypothetical protein
MNAVAPFRHSRCIQRGAPGAEYEACHDWLLAAIGRGCNWTFGVPDGINSPDKHAIGS